jgi:hypothetical protein
MLRCREHDASRTHPAPRGPRAPPAPRGALAPAPAVALALALAVAVAVVGCAGAQTDHDGAPHPRTAREYFPLSARAAWSFDLHDVDHPAAPTGLITMRVVRDDGGGGFYVSQGRGAPAVYEYADGAVTRNGEPVLREPLAAGTRWRGQAGDSYEIRAADLVRTVPAGTFHHVVEVVRFAGDATLPNGTEYRETYYYAPGVGPIETTMPLMVTAGEVRHYQLVLRGYTLDGEF